MAAVSQLYTITMQFIFVLCHKMLTSYTNIIETSGQGRGSVGYRAHLTIKALTFFLYPMCGIIGADKMNKIYYFI